SNGAGETRRCQFAVVGLQPSPAVVVAVEVGQQAAAGRRSVFLQCQRRRQVRQDWQQHRATAGFVGLRRAYQQQRVKRVFALRDTASETAPAIRGAEEESHGGEQQVWLPFQPR